MKGRGRSSRIIPKSRIHGLTCLVAGVLLLSGCTAEEDLPAERYELSGEVRSVDADNGEVTLAHEEIPGFMDAMTMSFPLADEWAFADLAPGDRVDGTLVVAGDSYWIEQVVISRKQGTPDSLSGIPDPEPGTPVPPFLLTNQDGRTIQGEEYRGKILVLTFIYSRCPLSDFCPRMTRHFATLESDLAKEPVLYDQTHLLTISFDPDYDTPETLKRYARQEGVMSEETFQHWEFATGEAESVRALATFFALDYWPDQDQILHTLRTAVITPEGVLFKLYRGNTWKPEEILADIRELSAGPSQP